MSARDDISKNIVYTDPDSTFNSTKNPQMIRKVQREPAIQNAVVHWVSRGDLSDISLRGKNEVRGGSAYDIVDLFNTASSNVAVLVLQTTSRIFAALISIHIL